MSFTPGATAVLFPGQGVAIAGSRERVQETCGRAFTRCCELLGDDPFERAGESTRFAQPAVFLASIASWIALAQDPPGAFAGHSLGELSALTAAGVFRLDDAVSLVVLRGELMADAADRQGDGGMLALLKGTIADARELSDAHGVDVANDNAPGQTVLSGGEEALREAASAARARGLRAIRLDVRGAFHSRAMQGACGPFRSALEALEVAESCAPVFSSMAAAPFRDVPDELARALVRSVRWRETMLALHAAGLARFLDVGPDRVLARLCERNLPQVDVHAAMDGDRTEDRSGVHA